MPIYAYLCQDCNEEIKLFHGVDETPQCNKCNSNNLQKQFRGNKVNVAVKQSSAKDRVEKFIEESRESLKQQIEESRKEYKQ